MYILLRLKAPLQSWGDNSKAETSGRLRATNTKPTQSAITGLICACMGINRDRNNIEYDKIVNGVKIISIMQKRNYKILSDYHTMGGGYDCSGYDENMVPRTAEGKIPVSSGWNKKLPSRAKLSTREYLQDADFTVVLKTTQVEVDKLVEKLKNPVWVPYFGRACCIPSERIYVGVFDNIEEADNKASLIIKTPY